MAKKYNIGSKSDMRRFKRDLTKDIQSMANKAIYNSKYSISCPNCHSQFQAKAGKNICPFCRESIDLQINID